MTTAEDAEEYVNDAYHQAWNTIPPQRPKKLGAWMGKVVLHLALNRWERDHAQKRYGGMTSLLSELEDCVPAPKTVEGELEDQELSRLISGGLSVPGGAGGNVGMEAHGNGGSAAHPRWAGGRDRQRPRGQ